MQKVRRLPTAIRHTGFWFCFNAISTFPNGTVHYRYRPLGWDAARYRGLAPPDLRPLDVWPTCIQIVLLWPFATGRGVIRLWRPRACAMTGLYRPVTFYADYPFNRDRSTLLTVARLIGPSGT